MWRYRSQVEICLTSAHLRVWCFFWHAATGFIIDYHLVFFSLFRARVTTSFCNLLSIAVIVFCIQSKIVIASQARLVPCSGLRTMIQPSTKENYLIFFFQRACVRLTHQCYTHSCIDRNHNYTIEDRLPIVLSIQYVVYPVRCID